MHGDTSPEGARRQAAVFRSMGPEGRGAAALRLAAAAFDLQQEAIAQRHPDYTSREIWLAAVRLRLGADLFSEAYPGEPALLP